MFYFTDFLWFASLVAVLAVFFAVVALNTVFISKLISKNIFFFFFLLSQAFWYLFFKELFLMIFFVVCFIGSYCWFASNTFVFLRSFNKFIYKLISKNSFFYLHIFLQKKKKTSAGYFICWWWCCCCCCRLKKWQTIKGLKNQFVS